MTLSLILACLWVLVVALAPLLVSMFRRPLMVLLRHLCVRLRSGREVQP